MLRYKLYIKDIKDAIEQIESVEKDKLKEKYAWDIKLMRLQVIGEAIKKIPSSIKKKFPEINWNNLAHLRNIISHEYAIVSKERANSVISEDLQKLKRVIESIK